MKTVVTQKSFSFMGESLWPEKKCATLNKAEFATLERAAKILEALEERVDPHQWLQCGNSADVVESTMTISCAASYLSEVLREGRHHFIDDEARLRVSSNGQITSWSPVNEEAP